MRYATSATAASPACGVATRVQYVHVEEEPGDVLIADHSVVNTNLTQRGSP